MWGDQYGFYCEVCIWTLFYLSLFLGVPLIYAIIACKSCFAYLCLFEKGFVINKFSLLKKKNILLVQEQERISKYLQAAT